MGELTTPSDPLREIRVWLIRVILWSLGLAAVLGVLSVLTGAFEVGWRAAGTAVLTAIAAGVLWSIGSIDPRHDRARYAGLAVTLLTYALFLMPLWRIGPDEELFLSAMATGGLGLVAVVSLLLADMARTRWTGRVGIASCGLQWLMAMSVIWADSGWLFENDMAEIWAAIAAFSTLAALCLIDIGLSARHLWRWCGVVAAGFGLGIALMIIGESALDLDELLAAVTTVSVVVAHGNLVWLANLRDRHRWLQWGTIAAAAVTGVCIDTMLLTGDSPELLERLTAAGSILTGVGSLALIVLSFYFRGSSMRPSIRRLAEIASIEVLCPACGRRQSLSLEGDSCKVCRLAINVHLQPAAEGAFLAG